jgi:hypothetical protein
MFKKIYNLVLRNAKLKLLALCIAVTVWLYGVTRLQDEAGPIVPLVIRVPAGYQLLRQSTDSVQVNIRGQRSVIARIRDQQKGLAMIVTLKSENIHGESVRLKVDPKWLNLSRQDSMQVHVTSTNPEDVLVYVSRLVKRSLPVRVVTEGTPRLGCQVTSRGATPAEVIVEAPALLLNTMNAVQTAPVPLWDVQADVRRDVPLHLSGVLVLSSGEQIVVPFKAEPSRVVAHVSVSANVEEREIEGVPVLVLKAADFPFDVQIPKEYARVTVVVRGVAANIRELNSTSIKAYVDVGDLAGEADVRATGSPYKRTVRLMPDDRIAGGRVRPEEITVILKKPE